MKDRSWAYIATLTVILGLVWLGVTAVSSFQKTSVPPDVEAIITPLDPSLNIDVLNRLSQIRNGQ